MIDKAGVGTEAGGMGNASGRQNLGGRRAGGRSRGGRVPFVEMLTSLLVHCTVVAILTGVGTVAVRQGEGKKAITVSLHAGARALQDRLSPATGARSRPAAKEPIARDGVGAGREIDAVRDEAEAQLAELVLREITAAHTLLHFGSGGLPRDPDERSGDGAHEGGGRAVDAVGGDAPQLHEADFGGPGGPHFLKKVSPIYPLIARRLGKEGKVVLSLTIDARGELVAVEVLERADFGFDRSAVDAVRSSTYLPAVKQGEPVASKARLVVKFVLDE